MFPRRLSVLRVNEQSSERITVPCASEMLVCARMILAPWLLVASIVVVI